MECLENIPFKFYAPMFLFRELQKSDYGKAV